MGKPLDQTVCLASENYKTLEVSQAHRGSGLLTVLNFAVQSCDTT